jgi:glycosyltransferase involved in cell wall biosynthesis
VRRLVFVTQQVDPEHPALAPTVAKIAALAERVDELVVLADGIVPAALPPNARAYSFHSATKAGRGLRFEAALVRELRPKPVAVVAHMCSIYAILAAPLVRPLGIPLLLWFTHWKKTPVLQAAEAVSTSVVSVDRRTVPIESRKLVAIGHGIDVAGFPCTERPDRPGVRALALGRTSPAKGFEQMIRAVALARARGAEVELDVYGPSMSSEERRHRTELEALAGDGVRIHEPVAPAAVPALLADADVLVNNMREGATDKVVFEAAASCVPVLASNPAFDELLDGLELDFPRTDEDALAARLVRLATLPVAERARIGRTLRERTLAGHSVDAWARRLLEVAERR